MDVIAILTFIKTLSPLEAFLFIGFLIIAINQGWINLKLKKNKKVSTTCLQGRAGACELIRKQMEMAEVYLDKVSAVAMDHYLAMRRQRTGEDIILAMDIESWCYELTLYRVGRGVKATVRSFFQANHLAHMTEDAFELYMKNRTDQIIQQMTSIMDKLYFPGSDPSRRELYDYNQDKLMPIFHASMEAVFREGRKLAIQFANGELDKYMERTNGN